MPDPRQLPFLVQLLGDDSPAVRERIEGELRGYGPALESIIAEAGLSLDGGQRAHLELILRGFDAEALERAWPEWMALPQDKPRLEAALGLLSAWLSRDGEARRLTAALDELAEGFAATPAPRTAVSLAEFLFRDSGLTGNKEDYYDPQNSNLLAVIERRRGIPLSLACIYILVSARHGLGVEGCNVPGHFLARAPFGDGFVLVDGFDGGRVFKDDLIINHVTTPGLEIVRSQDLLIDAPGMVTRTLRNLINAFQRREEAREAALCEALLTKTIEAFG